MVELQLSKVFFCLDYSSGYTAPTALGIRQEIEPIMGQLFVQRFENFSFTFLERFFTSVAAGT